MKSISRPRQQAGFALIITILLMAFLVLLMVSMASLTRVETQIAFNSQAVGRAQQNALMALNVAIGQLQKEAGPDQRITARAEILDSNATTTAIDTVRMPYLTGVWTTGSASPDILTSLETGNPQRQKTFGFIAPTAAQKSTSAKWLISTPTATDTLDPITGRLNGQPLAVADTLTDTVAALSAAQSGITGGSSSPTAVLLGKDIGVLDAMRPVDANATPPNVGYQVAAPLVEIKAAVPGFASNQLVGKYAYWVSDEGVKAKVNLKDSTLAKDSSKEVALNALHFSAPQATAGHMAFPTLTGSTVNEDFRTIANKVLTPQSLPLVPSVSGNASATPLSFANLKTFLPDITTYSYGVLADVRNGGLKKDLTATFEAAINPMGYSNVYNLRTQSIPLGTTFENPINPTYNSGLRWESLYQFYNLYKAVNPSTGTATTSAPSGIGDPQSAPTAGNPYTVAPRIETWQNQATAATNSNGSIGSAGSLAPVVIGYQCNVALEARPNGAAYTLYLRYYPQLTLHNPYAVSIAGGSFNLAKTYYVNGGGPIWCRLTNTDPLLVVTLAPGTKYYIRTYEAGDDFTNVGAASNATGIVFTATSTTPTTWTKGSVLQKVLAEFDVQINQSITQYQTTALQINDPNFVAMKPGEVRVYGVVSSVPAADGSRDITLGTKSGVTGRNSVSDASNYADGLVSTGFTADYAVCTELLAAKQINPPPNPTYTYDTAGNITEKSLIYIKLGNDTDYKLTNNLTDVQQSLNSLHNTQAWPNNIYLDPSNPLITGNNQVFVLFTTDPTTRNRTKTGIPTSVAGLGTGVAPTWESNKLGLTVDGSMPITSLYLIKARKKGVKKVNTTDGDPNYSNTTASVPVCHGNNGDYSHFNDSRILGNFINERYINPAYASYANLSGTVTQNSDTLTVAESWGQYSAGNGSSVDPATGKPTRTVLADVPIQPLTSLGQFMHMKPYYFFSDARVGPERYLNEPFGDMFIGGSVCPPNIAIGNTYGTRNLISVVADDSYLVNQVLFDSYFLSTVPPASVPTVETLGYPKNWTDFNGANTGTTLSDPSTPFLNTRIVPNLAAGTIALSALRDKDKASANLLLNGAFNINSTSVAAWKALLYSLSGNAIRMWDATGQAYFNFDDLNCPIPRCWSATSNPVKNTPWCSMRDLSDSEVTALAQEIVKQVKIRGPFLSMADFLNRRLGTASNLTRAGALQEAIDSVNSTNHPTLTDITGATKTDINQAAKAAGENTNPAGLTWQAANIQDALGVTWNTALGIPGYLMQQDLVQAFSPVMAARSDTFLVRTYGESINAATNKTESTAYCEAVVQRLPEFVDSSQVAETALVSLNTTNQNFGRRFKIISFRWLTTKDL